MAVNEPIDPRVRLAISQWPDDAPRGAVSTFCAEHGISRKSFYELRKRAKTDGPAAVLEPRTRRPRSSPSKLTDEVKAAGVAGARGAGGLRAGPRADQRARQDARDGPGPTVPSTASLARIFREAGVARLEPKKKPRSAWRRFVYPAPNACWQLDATEYVLTGGRKCVIFQLIDDHSRYAVASHVAWGETAKDAITVFDKAVAAHGVPQRLLSDNGLALNPSRRGLPRPARRARVPARRRGDHRQAVQADHPGQERTLPPDPVPLPRQAAARPRRSPSCRPRSTRSTTSTTPNAPTRDCPGRITPLAAWEATPKADPPRPKPDRPWLRPARRQPTRRPRPQPPADLPADTRVRKRRAPPAPSRWTRSSTRSTYDHALRAGPRRHRRRPAQDHHHRPRRRDPRRAHPTRTRHHLRRQRPTARNPPQEPGSVTEVLTHQLSPMS